MENSLNIAPENFGFDREKMYLDDPAVYIKLLGGGDDIFRPLGYMEMEKNWAQALEYAEFKNGIPSQTIRKDVISQSFTLDGNLKQLQPETVALLSNRKIVEGDGCKRVIMGTKLPSVLFCSIELVTQTLDGKEVRLRIRYAQITAEDFSIAMGGTEHASFPFKIEALKDDDPILHNPDWDYVGKTSIKADLTTGDPELGSVVFGTIDSVKIGGRIVGDGVPTGATVVRAAYGSSPELVMSKPAEGTATGQTLYVEIDSPDIENDNVAHWVFVD